VLTGDIFSHVGNFDPCFVYCSPSNLFGSTSGPRTDKHLPQKPFTDNFL
jgi:hypothetical protein